MAGHAPSQQRQRGLTAFVLVVVGVGLGVLIGLNWWLYPEQDATGCRVHPADGPALTAKHSGPLDLRLVAEPRTLALGRAIRVQHVTAQYGPASRSPNPVITDPARVVHLATIVTDVVRTTDGAQISQDRIEGHKGRRLVVASAYYQAGRVSVQLCVDRRAPQEMVAGTYQGTVSVIDRRVSRVDLPVTVTAEWPKWPAVVLVLVFALVGGSWYSWVLHEAGEIPAFEHRRGLSLEFARWCVSMIGMVSIGTGTAAAVGVFIAQYLNAPDWGSSARDVLTFLGSAFSAFVAFAGGLKIASVAAERRVNTPAAATRESDPERRETAAR